MIFKLLDSIIRPLIFICNFFRPRQITTLSATPRMLTVIKLSSLGDILCLLPSIITIKKHYPQIHVTLITTFRSSPAFIEKFNLFDKILVLDTRLHAFPLSFLSAISSVSHSDVVVDCDQTYNLSELITLSCPFSIGFFTSIKGQSFNVSVPYNPLCNERFSFFSLFLKLSECSNISLPLAPLLHLSDFSDYSLSSETYYKFPSLLDFNDKCRPLILLYPGSSLNALYRRWPLSSFKILYSQLIDNYDVIFVGGPSEVPLIPYLSSFVPQSRLFISRLTLFELSVFIANFADLLIGNDSSLIHLSELLNVPTFGLFGPNTSLKWGPLSDHSQSFSLFYPCSPCMHPYINIIPSKCCHQSASGQASCMEEIDPLTISAAVHALLD